LVIIYDFYLHRSGLIFWPFEADPILPIDPNRPLATPVSLKTFKIITLQNCQIVERSRGQQDVKPAVGLRGESAERLDELTIGETRGILVPEFAHPRFSPSAR